MGALLAWTIPAAVQAVDLWTPYAGDYEVSLDFGGRQRPYLVFVPKVIKYGGTMPLVIVLHGGGGHAASAIMRSRMNEAAEKKGFIAVYPNGTGRLKLKLLTWNMGPCCGYAAREQVDDVGFIRALINWLEANRPVTPGAVFVAGMSNGAMLCHRLGCELAEKISAIAPVAGSKHIRPPLGGRLLPPAKTKHRSLPCTWPRTGVEYPACHFVPAVHRSAPERLSRAITNDSPW